MAQVESLNLLRDRFFSVRSTIETSPADLRTAALNLRQVVGDHLASYPYPSREPTAFQAHLLLPYEMTLAYIADMTFNPDAPFKNHPLRLTLHQLREPGDMFLWLDIPGEDKLAEEPILEDYRTRTAITVAQLHLVREVLATAVALPYRLYDEYERFSNR